MLQGHVATDLNVLYGCIHALMICVSDQLNLKEEKKKRKEDGGGSLQLQIWIMMGEGLLLQIWIMMGEGLYCSKYG